MPAALGIGLVGTTADFVSWRQPNPLSYRVRISENLRNQAPIGEVRLGEKRAEALTEFVAKTDFVLDAAAENWAEWAPALATNLAGRKKLVRGDWENFYGDLAGMPSILHHLRGRHIFRMADGKLAAANSSDASEGYELFISPSTQIVARRRQRLTGTALFPPESIAKKMGLRRPRTLMAAGGNQAVLRRAASDGVQSSAGAFSDGPASR